MFNVTIMVLPIFGHIMGYWTISHCTIYGAMAIWINKSIVCHTIDGKIYRYRYP